MQQTSGGHTINAASVTCNAVGDPNFARQPINCVTQEQAATYCRSLGKRLPTEAEWELAARGTDGRVYPWGNDIPHSCRQAIVGGLEGPCGARKGTWEVATTVDGMSPSGVYDMAGNVWEWVADDFEGYPRERVVDPFLPPRTSKGIVRGGSWDYSGLAAKTSTRLQLERTFALNNVGFRCAK
jgi:formylglycine-generating enzyme required for sulfatase activity